MEICNSTAVLKIEELCADNWVSVFMVIESAHVKKLVSIEGRHRGYGRSGQH